MACLLFLKKSVPSWVVLFFFYFIENYGKGKKGLLFTEIDYFIWYESLFCHKEEPDADLLDKGIVT